VQSDVLARRAQPPPPAATDQFLLFRVGAETYGLGVEALWEVLPPEGITAPPHQVCTALAYRGRRLPLVRLAALFGVAELSVPPTARVLLAQAGGSSFGLLVDQVLEVVRVPGPAIAPVPFLATVLDPQLFRGVTGRDGRAILLLRAEGLGGLPEVAGFRGE
jgi:chemotaxis signal transduction protein